METESTSLGAVPEPERGRAAGRAAAAARDAVEPALERGALAEQLVVRLKGSPKAYPGGTHWHVARPEQAGTLEATWWPARRRLWLKVHPRRRAGWVEATAERLRAALERELGRVEG
ncbi:MAG TPA: hypothetical protein VGL23_06340 [Chloroflexota bacterium]